MSYMTFWKRQFSKMYGQKFRIITYQQTKNGEKKGKKIREHWMKTVYHRHIIEVGFFLRLGLKIPSRPVSFLHFIQSISYFWTNSKLGQKMGRQLRKWSQLIPIVFVFFRNILLLLIRYATFLPPRQTPRGHACAARPRRYGLSPWPTTPRHPAPHRLPLAVVAGPSPRPMTLGRPAPSLIVAAGPQI